MFPLCEDIYDNVRFHTLFLSRSVSLWPNTQTAKKWTPSSYHLLISALPSTCNAKPTKLRCLPPPKKPAKLLLLPLAANAASLQPAFCPRLKPFVPVVVSASAEEQVTSLKTKTNKGIVNEIPFSGLKQ
jgi:hypothetical protein